MNTCKICNTQFINKPKTTGLYCSISCGNRSRGNKLREQNKTIYVPSSCKRCGDDIPYEKRRNTFCSSKCAATGNTNRRYLHTSYAKNATRHTNQDIRFHTFVARHVRLRIGEGLLKRKLKKGQSEVARH